MDTKEVADVLRIHKGTVKSTLYELPWLRAATYVGVSPDGHSVAFVRVTEGDRGVWVASSDGINQLRLTEATPNNDFMPVWSPDGSRILFVRNRVGHGELFVMDSDGSDLTQVTTNNVGQDYAPDWSPDGTRIVFARNSGGTSDLYVASANGSDVRRITDIGIANRNETVGDPAWSPDGLRIVFTVTHGTEERGVTQGDIYMTDPLGSDVTPILTSPSNEHQPVWSPDGEIIYFLSDGAGQEPSPSRLFVMEATGEGVAPVSVELPTSGWITSLQWIGPAAAAAPALPTTEPSPSGPVPRDVAVRLPGVGPACGVTSVEGRFLDRTATTAYVFEREPEGGCDGPNEEFQFVGIAGPTGEVVVVSNKLRECSVVEGCWAFAAPDVDGDGRDEIAVATGHEYDALWFSLYRVVECGPTAFCADLLRIERFEIAEPGDPHEGFAPGPTRFRWGGPDDDVAGVTCGDPDEGPALVQWYSASYDQWLLIQGSQLETLPGSELDLTAGMLDELCGAPVAVDRPPSLTAG
jgi:dipeptidyl aminopeptidase/acylaminoacyl peptidase